MIDSSKNVDFQSAKDGPHHNDMIPDHADVHAMGAMLKEKDGGENLSSLFSSQMEQVSKGLKRVAMEKDSPACIDHQRCFHENMGEKSYGGDDLDENDLARDVAEHILVSDKRYMEKGDENGVFIKIKESILKDAAIHLIRQPDCLQVKLVSSSEQSIQTLVAARHSLEKQLEKNYDGIIRITIVHQMPNNGYIH
ncbi:MAG: hypothetical protein HQK66_10820 [Desulfamplus sp.]|nr:hypothetical protein [Desulfamplus sp.]